MQKNMKEIEKAKEKVAKELIENLENNFPTVDKIIDEELKEKEDWEICAYCGEDSRTEYKELRRYELLYPNDIDTNLEVKKKVLGIVKKIKMSGKLYFLLEFIGDYDPYLKRAAIRRKNYKYLKLCSQSYRQKFIDDRLKLNYNRHLSMLENVEKTIQLSKDFNETLSNEELANELGVKKKTVTKYKKSAREKLKHDSKN
jgi:DNA-binding CsgD family transcriptional regulator